MVSIASDLPRNRAGSSGESKVSVSAGGIAIAQCTSVAVAQSKRTQPALQGQQGARRQRSAVFMNGYFGARGVDGRCEVRLGEGRTDTEARACADYRSSRHVLEEQDDEDSDGGADHRGENDPT